MRSRLIYLAGVFASAPLFAAAEAEPSKEHAEFFKSKVEPILSDKCYKCHSVTTGKVKGGLALDDKSALAKGGDNGPIIKGNDPSKSMLITAINYDDADLQMPPKGEKLSNAEIAILTEWVKMGAPDPRKSDGNAKLSGLTDSSKNHWAYKPVVKPAVPKVNNAAWCVTPVDAFILQKLEANKMLPSPSLLADPFGKETLLRRASYDLLGLPPSPEEITAFTKDTTPQAFQRVIERMLASPHYGERWGRYWLDTARYSDTTGGDGNARRMDYRYPYAWTYRDWVINAFNKDLPYDEFITQQLAADMIPNNRLENLAALGFLTVGERFGNNNDIINDRIDVVSKGFLAMTVSCARCHDHMFDPITQKDYYAMHGIFASTTEPEEKPLIKQSSKTKLVEFEKDLLKVESDNRNEYYRAVRELAQSFRDKSTPYLKAAIRDKNATMEENAQKRQALIDSEKLEGDLANYIQRRIRKDNRVFGPLAEYADMAASDFEYMGPKVAARIVENQGGRYNRIVSEAFRGQQPRSLDEAIYVYGKIYEGVASVDTKDVMAKLAAATKGEAQGLDAAQVELIASPFVVKPASMLATAELRELFNEWPNRLQGRARLNFARVNEIKMTHEGSPVRAMVLNDRSTPTNSSVMIRGQANSRGDTVPRRFIEILASTVGASDFRKGSGRLELAQCIANTKNPLTARVLVNRVWMHHFGEGFVRTPDDLGNQAEKPSHPELLDYLSAYLMERKWSLKDLHRLIMNSRVYQISSHRRDEYVTMDPMNRLLWRANVRRLDFEAVRDSLLVMGDKIDRTIGGQPVNLTDEPYSYRRTVYGYVDRGNMPELMSHFDFSDPDMPNSKRTESIVPQQALFLMNSPMAIEVARRVVTRPEFRGAADDLGRIFVLYRVVLQRSPRRPEIDLAVQFLRQEAKLQAEVVAASKDINERGAATIKRLKDRQTRNDNDAYASIDNQGSYIERSPLTPWETLAQTLLLSNEAVYVN